MSGDAVLNVEDLGVAFATEAGVLNVVDGVSFSVAAGETLGIVGESGCGKSVTALAIMGLLPRPSGRVSAGRITLAGSVISNLSPAELSMVRGRRMSMIFQEPMTALNPVHRIGRQLIEALLLAGEPKRGVEGRAEQLLDEVGIPAPRQRLSDYPHQLSGGMRQRVLIAIALASRPQLLIADEPTTALDVTIQAQILELIANLQREHGMAVMFITHDLGVIAEIADEVVVMYGGRVVERASVDALFAHPRHPYTRGLLASIPRLELAPKTRLSTIPGVVPTLALMPSGCRFRNRCAHATQACAEVQPMLEAVVPASHDHAVACINWRGVPA
ncbi:MAG: ABC transporter ATP-binding protein [Gammaproteobacteria bacterium]|nr:ABC transporter ATP-binding protein [Gammaproteobacteria bacterium]